MTSCQDALLNNLYTNIQNFDNDIEFALEKRRLKRLWLDISRKRTADISAVHALIDSKYDSGFYIKKSYPGVPQEAINSVLEKYKVPNLDTFYRNFIVWPPTGLIVGTRNQFPLCVSASDIEKLSCSCFHAGYDKLEGCNTAGIGCYGGDNTKCDVKGTVNLFQTFIDKEKADAVTNIDKIIENFYNAYDSYTQRNKLVPNDVGCCQRHEYSNISANNIIFDNLTNQCSIVKN